MKSDKNGSGHCALCCCSLQCHIVQSRILLPPSTACTHPPAGPFVWLLLLLLLLCTQSEEKLWEITFRAMRLGLRLERRSGVGAVLKSRLSLLAFILKRKWSHIAYTYKVRTMWRIRNAIQRLRVCVPRRVSSLANNSPPLLFLLVCHCQHLGRFKD